VQGTDVSNSSTVEVQLSSQSLNSNHCYILSTSSKQDFVWVGANSTKFEQQISVEIAEGLKSTKATVINEGQESSEFWSILGGQEKYVFVVNKSHCQDTPQIQSKNL
jgi:hypothetical protein